MYLILGTISILLAFYSVLKSDLGLSSGKTRLNLFYNQILINKKNSIFLFITITFLAFVEMFIIGSLFPIINLFQKEEKILEFMLKIETFTNLDFELNYFIIFVIFSVVSLFFISSLLQTLSFYYSSLTPDLDRSPVPKFC